MIKHRWRYYGLAFLVWVAYFALAYKPEAAATAFDKYHISFFNYMLILASVYLPFLLCWVFAVAGWLYLRRYVQTLPVGADHHRGYDSILKGLTTLVLSILIPGIITSLYTRFVSTAPGPIPTWITLYVGLAFPLLGFWFGSRGSRQLLESIKLKAEPWYRSATAIVPILVFSVVYISLVFTNPIRQFSTTPGIHPTYYLPDPLILLTVVLPVIVTWGLGFRMVMNLEQYSHYVSPAQKPALVNVYNGSLVIIAGIILEQVIGSLGTSRLTGINLGLGLGLVYLLLIVLAVGFGLIARGAKQLAVNPTTG